MSGGRGSVGYVVRGSSNISENTRLTFCTTGILLRQLQSDCALDCITHIVIDEVHERNLDTDVLLAILKETRPPHLKIILMSATMDADRFASYWGSNTPRIHIPGRTFPVQDFTLEDALELTGYIPPKNGKKKRSYNSSNTTNKKSPWDDSEYSDEEDERDEDSLSDKEKDTNDVNTSNVPATRRIPIDTLLKRFSSSKIDYDLIARLVHSLIGAKNADDDGSILVFLPGVGEISQAEKAILHITGGKGMKVLPLHGGLQPQEQNKVFEKFHGVTKVILSTNVAETSITIPDCTMVIDTCKEKQSSFDPSNRMPLLIEKIASLDSLKQRRGRAGRVRPGICYKLISRETLSRLPEHGEPEIKRCSLDQTLLSLLFLGVEKGSGNFLAKLLDPPTQEALDSAVHSLKQIGAVTVSAVALGKEKVVLLTPLGLHIAAIPAPPMIGKLLVMGELLGCRSAALAIAAALSVGRSPFLKVEHPRNGRYDDDSMVRFKISSILEERSKIFELVGNSDHAMLAAIFMIWDELKGALDKKRYCESMGISSVGMRDIDQLVRQYDSSLSEAGFKRNADSDVNITSWRIIKSCIVSGLAPSQMVRIQRSSKKYAETVEGALEKDGEAKELKFFRRKEMDNSPEQHKGIDEYKANTSYYNIPEEQVFVHPNSFNFSTGSYSCPWVVFYQLVRTSKPFLRDITECSCYDLLLFAGSIDVLAAEGKIIIDSYVHLSANARIGALIGGLRRKVDELLTKKISDPTFELSSTIEMKIITKLLRTDGMGGP